MSDDDSIDWKALAWKVVPATDADRRAYWYWKGKCVNCHKAPQEVAGNIHMGDVKTHCYRCYDAEMKARKKEKK